MTAKPESAARERTATRRPDRGSPPAGTVEQLAHADPVAQGGEDARAALPPTGAAQQADPTRRMVWYGVAAYAVARLAWDRRFEVGVIMLAITLAVAQSALKAGAKDLIVGVERYYLHVEPRHLHLRRRRGRRRAAK